VGLAVFVVGTLILTAFIAWATYRSAQILKHMEVDFNLLLLPAENLLRVGLAASCFVLGWASGLPRQQFGWASQAPLVDVAIGLAAGLAIQLPLNALTQWAIARFGPQIYSSRVILSILPKSRAEWLLVMLALFPAVLVEELLFRSLWIGGLRLWAPVPVLVMGSALIFGAMHSPQGRLGVIMTAAVSLLLAGLFLWRQSVLPPLAAHYAINFLQLLVAYRNLDSLSITR
jgi:membrane protease YdiL (CAAX protease family)